MIILVLLAKERITAFDSIAKQQMSRNYNDVKQDLYILTEILKCKIIIWKKGLGCT
jgi:hypothetical protein